MVQFEYIIQDILGLHARPATKFIKLQEQFESEVYLAHNGKIVSGVSMMSLLSLGVVQGSKVTVMIKGADEDLALQKIKIFFKEYL